LREAGEVSRSGVCDLEVAEFWIVTDDGAAVGGPAYVELEAIAAVGKCEVEGRDGVLRDEASGAGTAMAKQERSGHLDAL
jgi:hypothetical protein